MLDVGPLPASIIVACLAIYIGAIVTKRDLGDYFFPLAFGIAPAVGMITTPMLFDSRSAYLSFTGVVLTTAFAVLATYLMLWIAGIATGFRQPLSKARQSRLETKRLVHGAIKSFLFVAGLILFATFFPMVGPCNDGRCRGLEYLMGEKSLVQTSVIWLTFLTNCFGYFFTYAFLSLILKSADRRK